MFVDVRFLITAYGVNEYCVQSLPLRHHVRRLLSLTRMNLIHIPTSGVPYSTKTNIIPQPNPESFCRTVGRSRPVSPTPDTVVKQAWTSRLMTQTHGASRAGNMNRQKLKDRRYQSNGLDKPV